MGLQFINGQFVNIPDNMLLSNPANSSGIQQMLANNSAPLGSNNWSSLNPDYLRQPDYIKMIASSTKLPSTIPNTYENRVGSSFGLGGGDYTVNLQNSDTMTTGTGGTSLENPGLIKQFMDNMNTYAKPLELIGTGLQGIGNFYNAYTNNKLAKDQLAFTKDFAYKNMANQTKMINTQLSDRSNARAASYGMRGDAKQKYTDDYMNKHGL